MSRLDTSEISFIYFILDSKGVALSDIVPICLRLGSIQIRQAAKEADVSPDHFRKMLHGKRPPTKKARFILEKYIGVDPWE